MTCIFCGIVAGSLESSKVYSDSICTAFMDVQPVNAGHVLIVPNRHAAYLSDITDEEAGHLYKIAHRVSAAIRNSGLRCEGINHFLADGEAAMQEVFHLHIHVFPRFSGDGFGLVHGPNYSTLPPRPDLSRSALQIANSLKKVHPPGP